MYEATGPLSQYGEIQNLYKSERASSPAVRIEKGEAGGEERQKAYLISRRDRGEWDMG